jgi:MFS family permease
LSYKKAFLAIYLSVAISYLGVGLVVPLIAIVLSSHGENTFVVGLVGTTMFAALTLTSFPIGALTDRVGPKAVLVGGLIVYGVSIMLFAMIKATWLFFIVRAVEGVGAAAISVATETMINQLSEPGERARRMSYYALSVGAGWAMGPLAGVLLFGVKQYLPFFACFALSLIASVLAAGLIPKTGSAPHNVERLSSVFSSKIVVPISAGALYGYLMSSLVTLFPLYLKAMGVVEKEMGVIITAVIAGTIVSQVPIGWAADRFGKRRTLLACSLTLVLVFTLMAFHTDWRLFIATGALAGAVAGSLYPVGLAMIGGIVRKERLGAATSLFSLAFGLGSLVGPSLSGLAMDHLGNRWLFYLPAALSAAFAVLLVWLYKLSASRKRAALESNRLAE